MEAMDEAAEGDEECYCGGESTFSCVELSKCGHFVHLECLEKYWSVNVSASGVRCPTCGRSAFKQVAGAKVSSKKPAVKMEPPETRSQKKKQDQERLKIASSKGTPQSIGSTTNPSKASSTTRKNTDQQHS